MKKILLLFLGIFLGTAGGYSQNIIKGIVLDSDAQTPIQGAAIAVMNTPVKSKSDANGSFTVSGLLDGSYVLEVRHIGYQTQKFKIELKGKTIDLEYILLYPDFGEEDLDLSLITIADDELNGDGDASDNIIGLLQGTKDVFLRTAAFEFSSSFFRIKGLDSGNGKLLINGIEMNKLYDGRPQWSNWGGLNHVLRNQEFSNSLAPSNYTFGGVLGSTNINTRASAQRPGVRISYSSSNRSYQHRVMATYSSGLREDGWAFTFSGSRRAGIEGFQEGTSYNAYSGFAAIEKKFNDKHSLNLTGIFAPNRRGKAAPMTQEVADLKGFRYNEYWGELNGNRINSRIKEVVEPILMLNHYWNITENSLLSTNISYQFGKIGNSRLDFNGGANPNPTYYQYLPSYNIRNGDFDLAYASLQQFQNAGQLDWNRLFDANITNANVGLNAAYVLYEDRTDDKQVTLNTILNSYLNDHITLTAKLEYKSLSSHNYAQVIDLLGGLGYLDVNVFAETETQRQNNVLTPNRVVGVGDRFRYNFKLNANVINAFIQAQFKYKKVDFYGAFTISSTSQQRDGIYQNGRFINNSLGLSKRLSFTNFGLKAGATYKITGRHLLDVNIGFLTQAPTIRNSFSNVRENNTVVDNLQSERIFSTDASYIIRSPIITSRLTGYYIGIQDATEISFYFADGVGGDNTAFVQEVLSGIHKNHVGVELGIEAQVTPTIKLKGVASVGQYTYGNNPNLYLTSDVANNDGFDANFRSKDYISFLKNYKIASGPHSAYSLGFEYRDPDFWWFGATTNFLTNTYADVAPLTRSSNFYEDADGLPFTDYDSALAKELLQQERFDDYIVVNLIGGKSWKIEDKYISVFATVNNLFNQQFKSGGFEQGRNANFRQLRDDRALDIPVFGNKYWFGRGATYFLNLNVSF